MEVIDNPELPYLIYKCKDRNDWLDHRVIGGTAAGVIVGVNPFKNKAQLFDELTSGKHNELDNEAINYGKNAEAHIRDLFRLKHKELIVIDPPEQIEIYVSRKYPFLTATPDGELIKKNGDKGGLEIKTCTINNPNQLNEWKDDNVPQHYYCQVLHYMNVKNYSFYVLNAELIFPRLREDGTLSYYSQIREYYFERKNCQDDINYLVNKEVDFYENNLAKNIRPDETISFDL